MQIKKTQSSHKPFYELHIQMSPSFIHAQATLLLRPETFQSETTPPTVFIADMLLLELTHTNLNITIPKHVLTSVNCARIPS